MYYDVSYDRALSPPAQTTPYGIVGGPSLCPGTVGAQVGFDEQVDYDLTRLDGQQCPASFLAGKRFAFISGVPKLLGAQYPFHQSGKSGQWISDRLPHLVR